MKYLSTGSNALDELLGGGLRKGTITQFYGHYGSGKTNICLCSAYECIKDGKKALYIDTEGGLSFERLKQITGDDFNWIIKNILLFEPSNFEEQDDIIIKRVPKVLKDVGLIVLDSAVALYRISNGEERELSLSSMLSREMASLLKYAREYSLPVVITNHVYSDFKSDTLKPISDSTLGYWSKIIVELRREKTGLRKARIIKHMFKEEGKECIFRITEKGLV